MLSHPCILGDHQTKGAAPPLPSWGPKRGRKCYVTLAVSGVPNAKKGGEITSGCLTPAFSGAQKRAEMLRHPCSLGGPQRQAWGQNQKWHIGGHIAYMHAF